MNRKPAANDPIKQLIKKGVSIPNPSSIDVGREVHIDQISGKAVKIYPGCRIYGEKTVISSGVQLGYEAPVTLDNCQLGCQVELKGGYFNQSVFLEKASMGLGAHVREACLLEEQAGGAHCVGLKHTILFPFVTLGSLINFCDCLMAGGTSRKDHSEVGSSYIHFNFTPEGDKATASLIGDVPRGVMLNKPPIFLGGQGGMVGPLRMGYGNVVAAGSVLRKDADMENKLILSKSHPGMVVDLVPRAYPGLSRVVENNILYITNLIALEQWYIHVRRIFFEHQEFGNLIFQGVLEKLKMAKGERIKRLKDMASKMPAPPGKGKDATKTAGAKEEFSQKIKEVEERLAGDTGKTVAGEERDRFLTAMGKHREKQGGGYIDAIQSLPRDVSRAGTQWLDSIVDRICDQVATVLPALNIFKKSRTNIS
ncbi:MAG: UDP-N-acetylglucosamine pyrophosphorylase [Deltaproteobacteria bacterium SM23_61]|nr:MAG: UDP-N-acetylglucosamine pyrophosphorylase [Deltaproteobacteria bacterium SM23_61]